MLKKHRFLSRVIVFALCLLAVVALAVSASNSYVTVDCSTVGVDGIVPIGLDFYITTTNVADSFTPNVTVTKISTFELVAPVPSSFNMSIGESKLYTVKNKDNIEEASISGNIILFKVDVEIDGVGEDKEETEGAFAGYAPCNNGVMDGVCETAMKPVKIRCLPANRPDDEKIILTFPRGHLFEKVGDAYNPAQSFYKVKEINSKEFYLHGHEPSESIRNFEIKATHNLNGCHDVAKYTVAKIEITGFTDNEPYCRHEDCPIPNHQTKALATIKPAGSSPITFSIKSGADIDSNTGVITPKTNSSGTVSVKCEAVNFPEISTTKDLVIKARPLERISCTVEPSNENILNLGVPDILRSYGGDWTHTFSTSGGSLSGQVIGEEIKQTSKNDFKFAREIELGTAPEWILDASGTMNQPDTYEIRYYLIYLFGFWPDKLPAESAVDQKYFWKCPKCLIAGENNAWRLISGPSKIRHILYDLDPSSRNIRVKIEAYAKATYHNYVGVALIENLLIKPNSIPADGSSTANATADIIPKYRKKLWDIDKKFNCRITSGGLITAGTIDGTATVWAEAEEAYSSVETHASATFILTKP